MVDGLGGISDVGILGLQNGTAGAPALWFVNDPTTGLYLNSAGQMGVTVSGTQVAAWTANGLAVGVGISGFTPIPLPFQVRTAQNVNLQIRTGIVNTAALGISSVNDANGANIPMELRASQYTFQIPSTPVQVSAGNLTYSAASIPGFTLTVSGNTQVTALNGIMWNFGQPTISAALALTIVTASTVYIAGPPVGAGAGPASFTNTLSLHVASGITQLGLAGTATGSLRIGGATSGNVTMTVAAAAGTWTLTLPVNAGANGEALVTDGTGVCSWSTSPVGPWSSLTNPTAALNLTMPAGDETTFTVQSTTQRGFTWTSSTITTGGLITMALTGASAVATAASNGTLATFSSTSTGFTGATQSLVGLYASGANANASVVMQGLAISVTNTGATNTNTALLLTASGAATANYAINIVAGGINSQAALTWSHAGGAFALQSTSQSLTIATLTSGTLAITSAGALNLTGVAASTIAFSGGAAIIQATSQNLTVQTVTSGTLALTSAGALTLTVSGANNIAFAFGTGTATGLVVGTGWTLNGQTIAGAGTFSGAITVQGLFTASAGATITGNSYVNTGWFVINGTSQGNYGGQLTINSTDQFIVINNSTGGADAKTWRLRTSATLFTMDVVNDANTVSNIVCTVTRSGVSVTGMTIFPALTLGGTPLAFSQASSITTTAGALTLAPVSGSNLVFTVAGVGNIVFTLGTGTVTGVIIGTGWTLNGQTIAGAATLSGAITLSAAATALTVNNNTNLAGAVAVGFAGNPAGSGINVGASSTNNSFWNASQGAATTTMYIGNASITVVSDRRLKTNITPTGIQALDLLSQLHVVDYTWNDPSEAGNPDHNRASRGRWTGLTAQDVAPVFPWLVNAPDLTCQTCLAGLACTEVDAHGHDHISYWGLDLAHMAGVFVKGFQEVDSRITALERENQELRARVAVLEAA